MQAFCTNLIVQELSEKYEAQIGVQIREDGLSQRIRRHMLNVAETWDGLRVAD